jgi:hypothetical protein
MRKIVAVFVLFLAVGSIAHGQEKAEGKKSPTDEAIINTCGSRLVKVFAQFGTPVDLFPQRGNQPDGDSVTLDYGTFGFQIRQKTVQACFFWAEWPGTIKGFKIGSTRAEVVKLLGDSNKTFKNSEGTEDLGWNRADLDAVFWVDFDKDNKVRKVEVILN